MLIIEVELLGGRYATTAYNDRSRAEWPPHPARFFSALVAALHENDPADPQEREALLWLEQQEPPPSLDVDADAGDGVGRRRVLDVFVPVNDVSLVGDVEKPLRDAQQALASFGAGSRSAGIEKDLKRAKKAVETEEKRLAAFLANQQVAEERPSTTALTTAVSLLPAHRTRQKRTFPVVLPARPSFAFIWSVDVPSTHRPALAHLCERVTRLGHSSSLVRCAIVDRCIAPTLVPDDDGKVVLRTVGPGQLQRLEQEFTRHQGVEPRFLPALPRRYGPLRPEGEKAAQSTGVFSDEWIVFERVDGARPLSSRGTDLARALRKALIEQQGARTLPASLSGHREDGGPVDHAHIAFVALPFVGHPHADGSVKGCAIVLPRGLAASERETLLRLVAAWEVARAIDADRTIVELAGEALPPVRFQRVELSETLSLQPGTWSRPARRFVTATPIALDRNPGNLRSNQQGTAHKASVEAQRTIADACERIDLPRPLSVEISLAPLLTGAQPVHAFLPWPGQPGQTPRVRVHADIRFSHLVRGPVILGAGRFFGLGLCLPWADEETR